MIELPNDVLFAEVEDCIARGESVIIPFAGISMFPALRDRKDKISLSPLSCSPKRGDVLLFRHNGTHILHRVIKVDGDLLTMQGDNCISQEIISTKDIVAILTNVHRTEHRNLNCEGMMWKIVSAFSVSRREIHCFASKYFHRTIRRRLSPFYFLGLFLLMWMPVGVLGIPLNNFVLGIRLDHLLHASIYIPCTLFLLDHPRLKGWGVWLMAFFVAILTESVQYLLPYRGFDINDLVANFLGVTLGWIVVRRHKK